MNLKSLICILAVIIISCKDKKSSADASSKSNQDTAKIASTSIDTPTPSNIKELASLAGQTPTQAKIFEIGNLNKRFEKLMGEHYEEFKSDWNQETPIMKDGEILYFIGCKANSCNDNKFFVMIDLVTDNINVIHMKNRRPVSHEESSVIGMTEKMAADFEKSRSADGPI